MAPLPNHKTIPDRWQTHHQPTIAATFRTDVTLSRPNPTGTRNTTTSRTAFAAPTLLYDGKARVQSRSSGTPTQAGDRAVTTGNYLVAVPPDVDAHIGDLVTIVDCPDAPALNGATLKVVDAPGADIAWQRSYGCDLEQPAVRG